MKLEDALALVNSTAPDEEVDALLVELLKAPSPQTENLEADRKLRDYIQNVVTPRIESLTGLRPQLDAMGNLVLSMGGKGDGLIFMGYAMTFPAASMPDPFSGAIVSGELFQITGPCAWGRGACEQKGPLAAMIGAANIVVQSGACLQSPFYLVVSLAGETGRHDAAKFILEHNEIAARHGIVGLGTCNRVCLGNKGRIDVEILIRGKSSHSSTPWAGINAIEGTRKVMDRLDALPLEKSHPHLGQSTLTTTRIESGPAISHTVQDMCRLVLDRRLLPREDTDEVFESIEKALCDLEPWKVEVRRGAFMYPSEVSPGCPVALSLQAACDRISGKKTEPFYSAAALDAGFLNQRGIETVMFGPGDLRFAHTDQEMVSVAEVRAAARIYAATALQLLA